MTVKIITVRASGYRFSISVYVNGKFHAMTSATVGAVAKVRNQIFEYWCGIADEVTCAAIPTIPELRH